MLPRLQKWQQRRCRCDMFVCRRVCGCMYAPSLGTRFTARMVYSVRSVDRLPLHFYTIIASVLNFHHFEYAFEGVASVSRSTLFSHNQCLRQPIVQFIKFRFSSNVCILQRLRSCILLLLCSNKRWKQWIELRLVGYNLFFLVINLTPRVAASQSQKLLNILWHFARRKAKWLLRVYCIHPSGNKNV